MGDRLRVLLEKKAKNYENNREEVKLHYGTKRRAFYGK